MSEKDPSLSELIECADGRVSIANSVARERKGGERRKWLDRLEKERERLYALQKIQKKEQEETKRESSPPPSCRPKKKVRFTPDVKEEDGQKPSTG